LPGVIQPYSMRTTLESAPSDPAAQLVQIIDAKFNQTKFRFPNQAFAAGQLTELLPIEELWDHPVTSRVYIVQPHETDVVDSDAYVPRVIVIEEGRRTDYCLDGTNIRKYQGLFPTRGYRSIPRQRGPSGSEQLPNRRQRDAIPGEAYRQYTAGAAARRITNELLAPHEVPELLQWLDGAMVNPLDQEPTP
jgi:hypothetical protein